MWGYLFGGSQSKKDSAKKAIVDLRTHIDMLSKKESYVQNQIEEQDAIARKNVTTNKTVAKAALKRKKVLMGNLEKVQGQIDTLESQLNSIETANLNFETLKAMQQGAKVMKNIHGSMNVDKVDSTMDEIRDQVAISEEIGDAISRPLGQEIDEDELLDELADMEQEQLDAKMVHAGPAPAHNLPSLGSGLKHPVEVEEEEDEEEELARLQAEMAL
ncbi:Snf7-domain-containing protein [Nadsonia fulvescens var. elongata DSM 6958]|uniref:Vacuolar-sorting protein SNF7 n=1 Tax=Nadsonia fulvescens var. elongata DSM 6958 TaxID=857566 RepID=A0A1E3PKF8_9ASCO|nr:Snf7-domain-containing protein [Nadsonia fulvescens var. elongata DSM 6958]